MKNSKAENVPAAAEAAAAGATAVCNNNLSTRPDPLHALYPAGQASFFAVADLPLKLSFTPEPLIGNREHHRHQSNGRTLSGGQQQRLCIARALILQPEVLLLDEPTSSLDLKTSEKVEELLLELKKECTLILVSRYQDQVQRIADRIYVLNEQQLNRVR